MTLLLSPIADSPIPGPLANLDTEKVVCPGETCLKAAYRDKDKLQAPTKATMLELQYGLF